MKHQTVHYNDIFVTTVQNTNIVHFKESTIYTKYKFLYDFNLQNFKIKAFTSKLIGLTKKCERYKNYILILGREIKGRSGIGSEG